MLRLLLFAGSLIILGASVLLSFKTRFIQIRMLPQMFKMLIFSIFKKGKEGKGLVRPHKALFTAMSTTIGISTIVAPIIAIQLGGPGAMLGFILATMLGAAVNFTEVTFALRYRKKEKNGMFSGGPMQYLHDEIAPFLAKIYACCLFVLMMVWSAAQANQLAELLNSPMLGSFRIPNMFTGLAIAFLAIAVLMGGIKRVASLSTKLVPVMFCLFVSASLYIVCCNLEKLPAIFQLIWSSAFTPKAMGGGTAVGGLMMALRWGIFKGIHSSEAGVGTQTIPHSMADTQSSVNQGILGMLATFSACFLCVLSGLVALVTEPWLDQSLSLGINMVTRSYQLYFSYIGVIVIVVSAILFAFGTIVGNGFNGSQCFTYLSKGKFIKSYYFATAGIIFLGTIADVAFVWSNVDLVLVPAVLINTLAIVYLSYKRGDFLSTELALPSSESSKESLLKTQVLNNKV
ncbi:MAG: sodium:alanine symporter family protein, partial [Chlamydiia bacterium]|nr:sodium:alanine symporter family protein [Chlamydiia bacterium]